MSFYKLIPPAVQHAGSTARRATLLHNKIQDVEAWMDSRRLPRRLRREITSYYADAWLSQAGAPMNQ